MINHFWNLCRGCPNTGIDKLHSEYRSTYRWHEYHSPATKCVIRRAPKSSGGIGNIEDNSKSKQLQNHLSNKEKSISNGSAGGRTLPDRPAVTTTAPRSSHANQVITGHGLTDLESSNHKDSQQPQTPRKSKSMGRIHGIGGGADARDNVREGIANPLAAKDEGTHTESTFRGHRRVPSDGIALRHSKALEGEHGGMDEDDRFLKRSYKSEYRKKFRPFSQYQYIDGKFQKAKNEEVGSSKAWYKEVLELRRQAGQYRAKHDSGKVWETVQCRGWGVETASERMTEIYSKQLELWEQVSRRSSLQALSLASSTAPSRPISKAEKELENSRRSSPLKHSARDRHITSASKPPKPTPIHKTDKGELKTSKETTPRHHYDKTSGSAGHFITSPTRVKLDPAYPNGVTGGRTPRKSPSAKSPTKDFITKKSSPRTISVPKVSPTKEKKSSLGRSVSVGPENRSPKRTSRPPSTHAPPPTTKNERRPRPTSLSANSRRKDAVGQQEKKPIKKPIDVSGSPKRSDFKAKEDKKRSSIKDGHLKDATDAVKDSFSARKATPEPRFYPDKYEPVVKTPPEPTRVKSPDQVLVKSPDPVNWTVPLDTGKTFTVTHNIPEGSPTKRLAKGEASRSTSSSEHRSRQTPEPTKVYQESIAGTPITTAGTIMPTEPVAITSSASGNSTILKVGNVKLADDKQKIEPSAKIANELMAEANKTTIPANIETPVSQIPADIKVQPTSSVTFNDKVAIDGSLSSQNVSSADKPIKKSEPVVGTKTEDIKELGYPETSRPYVEPFIGETSNKFDSSGFSTEIQDPMTMSIFGSLNGVREKPKKLNQTNDGITKTTTVADSKPLSSVPPISNIRRLDDPFLEQSSQVVTAPNTMKAGQPVATVDPMTSSIYKVLEDPSVKEIKSVSHEKAGASTPYRVLEAPSDIPPVVKSAPYRVLEAPLADFNSKISDPVKETKQPTHVAPPSGNTMAASLDKAHNRFDSHWSASDKNTAEHV